MTLHQNWFVTILDDQKICGEIKTAAELAALGGTAFPAQVPGDWPLDYVKQGMLDEPFFGDNYMKLLDYENSHVYYTLSFDWQDEVDERCYLQFDGIDTVADVYLNGQNIGHAENMYIPHEFQAIGLKQGANELLVHISPVCLEARKYPIIGVHHRAQKYNYESLVIRKAAHCFGWDICPRIVSAGLWRDVRIVHKKPARLENVFLWLVDLSGKAHISFDVEIGRDLVHDYEFELEGHCRDSHFHMRQKLWYVHGSHYIQVDNLHPWWVRGYGEPDRYEVTARLYKNGELVDERSWLQGLRTIELVRDDAITNNTEAEFCFVLNAKRIYIKGTNWVPADAFHSNDANRIPAILDLVWDCGCNAMRIWGGGVYENDFFYDWCDEHGIMLWQDFMMACALYPNHERMMNQLCEEATAIIRRLRHHVSICLWAGDNECDQVSWLADYLIDPTDNLLTRHILPEVLRAEDISRPYLPSSPYVSHDSYVKRCIQETPEQHLWGPRAYFKDHFYHDHKATFASEMGYHGCNSPSSIRKFIPKTHLWPEMDNEMWLYHAASPEVTNPKAPYNYRISLMSSQIGYLFNRKPKNLDDYARMSQICQAEAKKYFVESFRSHKGVRTGLIWWNIMDCWPQFSDAVVDYYFCRKLAYFFIRRSQQPLCLMMDDKDGPLHLYAVSDLQEPVSLRYRVWEVDTDAELMSGSIELAADCATDLALIPDDGKQHFYAIEWETADGQKGLNHYLMGKPLFDYDWYMACLGKLGLDEFEGFEG